MACSNNSTCGCDTSYCIGNSDVLENQEKQVCSYCIVHLIPMALYYHTINIRRVLFTYMEDTKSIENPVYSDTCTDGAYPESKEDEVMRQHCNNLARFES